MLKNKSQRELIELSKSIVQPLLPHYYKGQSGKIAVIGGCEDYTGAPYFASSASALIGSDLSHVICEKQAAPIIKTYSPDLMVHPYLYDLENPIIEKVIPSSVLEELKSIDLKDLVKPSFKSLDNVIEDRVLPKVMGLINRCDLFVIGPGFGRDYLMVKSMIKIIEQIKVANKPMILDADALYIVSLDPNIVKNYSKAILTPNLIEFERIGEKLGLPSILKERDSDKIIDTTKQLSKLLGDVTIIRKGEVEIIATGDDHLVNSARGSSRRVGGQGDTLTGCLATFVNWSYHYQSNYWDIGATTKLTPNEGILLASFAASSIVRHASNKAFKVHGRSMQTSNIQSFLGETYNEFFDNEDFIKL